MIVFQTIVLDGLPYLREHLPVLESLSVPWKWLVCEGAALNVKCTAWCKPQPPRLSRDGTTEYLNSIAAHPNVTVLRSPVWHGKVEMFRAMTYLVKEPCILCQLDSDEIYTTEQLEKVVRVFEARPLLASMRIRHRYYFGPDLVATQPNGSQFTGDWLRFWRFRPGMRWDSHEPPSLAGNKGHSMPPDESLKHGVWAEHYSYTTEAQVAMKEALYGYTGAVKSWRELQACTKFPVPTKRYIPWSKSRDEMITRLKAA